MARMYPDVALDEIEHGSERAVYDALRNQLDDGYTVLHSYPWLRRASSQGPIREGETDFLVLHPERGLLILEVKGGELRLEQGQWHRKRPAGLERIKDPFEQARRNMHALLGWLEDRIRVSRNDWGLVYGYAVVFPHCDYRGALPANAERAMVLGYRDMATLDQGIARAFAAWGRSSATAAPLFRHLLDTLLPRFQLISSLAPELAQTARRIHELTEDQQVALEGLFSANHRVLVEGVAGSGKTLLALHRAKAHARQGQKCLFVCFNQELAAWLREQIEAELRDRLHIWHFHALARRMAELAGLSFTVPTDRIEAARFWDDTVPDLLEQAATILEPTGQFLFDAIVVDEAQDFCELWWFPLTDSLLKDPDGPLYVFIDPNQSLRATAAPPPELPVRYRLMHNCRNTRKIAHTSAAIIRLSAQVHRHAPVGQDPEVYLAESATAQRQTVQKLLQRLLVDERLDPRQIALIGPRRKDRGSLTDLDSHAGKRLITSAGEWRQGHGVLVTTTRSFKGLEADVVVLYDLDGFSPVFTEADLYVACSRARFLLVVVVRNEAMRVRVAGAVRGDEGEG